MALLMMFLGPFVINFLLVGLINLLVKASDKDGQLSMINRFIGSIISVVWAGILVFISIFLFSLIPGDITKLTAARGDVVGSKTYAILKRRFPIQAPRKLTMQKFQDTVSREDIQESKEYQNLVFDPKVKSLLQDTALLEEMQGKNINEVMDNPKMKDLVQDPALIEKLFRFYQKVVESEDFQSESEGK